MSICLVLFQNFHVGPFYSWPYIVYEFSSLLMTVQFMWQGTFITAGRITCMMYVLYMNTTVWIHLEDWNTLNLWIPILALIQHFYDFNIHDIDIGCFRLKHKSTKKIWDDKKVSILLNCLWLHYANKKSLKHLYSHNAIQSLLEPWMTRVCEVCEVNQTHPNRG